MELVFRDDSYARTCDATVTATAPEGIQLDRTVFYARSGGQPGDSGRLIAEDSTEIVITEAVKGATMDDVVHVPAEGSPVPEPGARVRAEINWERRYRLMRVHTAMHLMCALIPGAVTGGSVGDGKGRLDFDIPEAGLDKDEITAKLNRLIAEDHAVTAEWISDEELVVQPELVKTMSVKPPTGAGQVRLIRVESHDLQPCGGTHVAQTAEIGAVTVTKIEKKGRQNRRVTISLNK